MISKRGFLASLIGGSATLLASGIGPRVGRVHGQGQESSLEGSWMSSVVTGSRRLRTNLLTFTPGGGMVTTSSDHLTRGPGHGTWVHLGGREFAATSWQLRFDAQGTYAGQIKFRSRFTLDESGDRYTSRSFVEFYDVEDTLESSNTAMGQGTRIPVVPPD